MLSNNIKKFDASKKTTVLEFVSKNINELFLFRHALYNFISTNLSSRYRRSTIGFFWSLLNPLFTMLIMAVVFSSLYKRPFAEFSLYLFSGLLPWNLITSSLLGSAKSLISSEIYLKKIYVPKILFPLITIGVELINFGLSLISLCVLVFAFGSDFGISVILLPVVLLLLAVFLFGLVLIISITTVFFRDLAHILQIVLVGMFYFTPILFQINMISPELQNLIAYNPFYHFINLFHLIFYESVFPSWADWQPCILLALLSLVVGIYVFQKKENDVIYRL